MEVGDLLRLTVYERLSLNETAVGLAAFGASLDQIVVHPYPQILTDEGSIVARAVAIL